MLRSITPCSDHMLHLAHSTTLIFSASTVMGDALRSSLSLHETYTDESSCNSESFVHSSIFSKVRRIPSWERVSEPLLRRRSRPVRARWGQLANGVLHAIKHDALLSGHIHEHIDSVLSNHLLNGLPCLVSSHQDPNTQRPLGSLAEQLCRPQCCRLVATRGHLLAIATLFPKRCMASAWVRECIRLTDAFVEIILVHVCCFSVLHNSS